MTFSFSSQNVKSEMDEVSVDGGYTGGAKELRISSEIDKH